MDSFPKKDPDSVLDYTFDWTSWLAEKSDTIASYAVAVDEGDGLAIDSHSRSGGVVTVWLSGGTEGTTYLVRCRVVTTGGRTEDHSRLLTIAPK